MRRHFKKPLFLGCASCLTALTTVTPIVALTSCSNEIGEQKDETDQRTGISSITYRRMKKEFRVKYEDKLRHDEFLSDADVAEKLAEFDDWLLNFDASLQSDPDNPGLATSDYTAATMALSEAASTKYQIILTRRSNVTWSDFSTQYKHLKEATYTYLWNHQVKQTMIDKILADGDRKFDELLNSVVQEYPYDPLLGITKSQTRLLDIYETTNAEAAFIASMNRLSDFTNRFSFEYYFNEEDPQYYEDLVKNIKPGDEIKPKQMKQIFHCVDQQTGNPRDFDNKMLPGYYVTPRLSSWYENPYSNIYGMDIDWEIYPTSYVEYPELQTYLPQVTAHLYGRNEQIEQETYDPNDSLHDIIDSAEHITTRYFVKASSAYEVQAIQDTYFDENKTDHICLEWQNIDPSNEKNKYECFFDGIKEETIKPGVTGKLDRDSLAHSGLRISPNGYTFEDLSDVIDRMDRENHDPENARPDEQLGLDEKFVKYCTLNSKVTIDDDNKHEVSHVFSYQYANSSYKNDSIYTERRERHSDGFLVSKEFFVIANQKYDEAYKLFKRYKDNSFNEIKKNANDLEASFMSNSCMTGVMVGVNMAKFLILFAIPLHIAAAYNLALLAANAAVLGIIWPHYKKHLVYPIEDYVNRVKMVRKDPCFDAMQARLIQDKELFCVSDDNGKFPKKEYETKEGIFRGLPFGTTRPLFQYYSTIMVQKEFADFRELTIKYNVDPLKFKEEYGTWKYTGECYLFSYGYSGIRMLIGQMIKPVIESPLFLTLAEFAIETWIGNKITETLQQTAYKYEYVRD